MALALREGVLDAIPVPAVAAFRQALPAWLDQHAAAVAGAIGQTRRLDEAGRPSSSPPCAAWRRPWCDRPPGGDWTAHPIRAATGQRGDRHARDCRHRAQQSRGLLPAIDAYARMIAGAITQALPLVPPDGVSRRDGPSALVLFGAEQGFAGAFGDRMMAAVEGLPAGTALFLIGSRAARHAAERGLAPAWQTAMAAHTGAITALATRIAEALYTALPETGFHRVEMVFPVWQPGAEMQVQRRWLLPLDPGWFQPHASIRAPLITLPPARLLEQLAEEYVTARLCEAATHAFAAENEARAAAMMRAKTNIAGCWRPWAPRNGGPAGGDHRRGGGARQWRRMF